MTIVFQARVQIVVVTIAVAACQPRKLPAMLLHSMAEMSGLPRRPRRDRAKSARTVPAAKPVTALANASHPGVAIANHGAVVRAGCRKGQTDGAKRPTRRANPTSFFTTVCWSYSINTRHIKVQIKVK